MLERIAFLAVVVAASTAVLAAGPQAPLHMYKCVDAKGKTYYTQTPPQECLGRATQELSREGRVVKQNEIVTPEQLAARAAEKKKKAEAEKLAAEERRKNTALLNSYSDAKDIEEARTRAIKQVEQSIKASETKIAAAEKRRAGFDREKEFYAKKPLPARLQQDIQDNELTIQRERELVEARKKEISSINVKYDEDKRRFLELTRGAKN